jgi:hypothetical protein
MPSVLPACGTYHRLFAAATDACLPPPHRPARISATSCAARGSPSFSLEVSQNWLIRFVEHRIGDPRIIRLIRKWLRAGVLEDGVVTVSEKGTGQGVPPQEYAQGFVGRAFSRRGEDRAPVGAATGHGAGLVYLAVVLDWFRRRVLSSTSIMASVHIRAWTA